MVKREHGVPRKKGTITTMTTAAKKPVSKYTPAIEARIREQAPLNQAKAEALSAELGKDFSARSIAAYCSRKGIAYERKQPTTKSGGKIEHKNDIVAEIAAVVGANLDGLEKAPKPALQAIRNYQEA